jgi:ribonuclease HI
MAETKKFYAVKRGNKPGIYRSWEECRRQVNAYPQADYKSFSTLKDARDYLQNGESEPSAAPVAAAEIRQTLSLKLVVMYTDGACTGNPGPGGYGVVLIHGTNRKELSAGFRMTTNNRMEIFGCIAGLRALREPCEVLIYSDSKYVVDAMTKSWVVRWRNQGWKRKDKNGGWQNALNSDLWAEMLDLCDQHNVTFNWVRGHSGNKENERCDQLARAAAAAGRMAVDAAYENRNILGMQSLTADVE